MSDGSVLEARSAAGKELVMLMDAGATPTTLATCEGLAEMVLEELGLRLNLRPARRAAFLGEILSRVLAESTQTALRQLDDGTTHREANAKAYNQVAAAGELLDMGNKEAFQNMRLARLPQMSAKWENLLRVKDNRGQAGMRRLRAALWLGRRSAKTGKRQANELCIPLESAIKAHLADDDVAKEYRDRILVEAAESRSSDEAPELSPASSRMDEDVAVAEMQALLPWLDDVNSYRLALALDLDPKLMGYVGAHFQGGKSTVREACRILSVDPALFFASIAAQGDAIEAIGRQTVQSINSLEAEYPRSAEALEFLAFTYHENIPFEYLASYFIGGSYVKKKDLYHARMVLDQIAGPLKDRDFIDFRLGMVRVNPLAQAIWRSHFQRDSTRLRDKLLTFAQSDPVRSFDLLAEGWSPATTAGRRVCNSVMAIRLQDQLDNRSAMSDSGRLSGAEFVLVIREYWSRLFMEENCFLILHRLASDDRVIKMEEFLRAPEVVNRDLQAVDWFTFIHRLGTADGRKALDAAFGLIGSLIEERGRNSDMQVSGAELLAILRDKLLEDEVQTRLGVLRMSSVFPGIDTEGSLERI